MKKTKKVDSNSINTVKLPLIQNNNQRGNRKDSQRNSSKKNDYKDIPQIPNIPLTRRFPSNEKPFNTSNLSLNARSDSNAKKNKINYINDNFETINPKTEERTPKFSEEQLTKLRLQRRQRLKKQRKEEEIQFQMYEKIIEEYKNNPKLKKTINDLKDSNEGDPQNIISSKKAQNILESGGMLDAYKYVLAQLCKNGLPKGNIFEYASYVVKNYEKKWKEKKSQMIKDKIDKYYEEKQKEINKTLEVDPEIKIVNKSLEHRNELKFIQNLDKSRSGIKVVPLINYNISPRTDRFSYYPKNCNNSNNNYKKKYNKINENDGKIGPIKLKDSSVETNNKINSKENQFKGIESYKSYK